MEYMYITNQPEIARIADEIGIDRVWIDLEYLGKEERQKGLDSVKSRHKMADVPLIRRVLKKAQLQVRINPINPDSREEIEQVIAGGADIIMLPYYKTLREVDIFLNAIHDRVQPVLLLETCEAEHILERTLKDFGHFEVHIGLNDLHLSYHKKFMFELLADGTVERICLQLKESGLRYGFGGIARLGQGILPAEYILPEHFRLGSTRAILSRSFFDPCNYSIDKAYEMMKSGLEEIRKYEHQLDRTDEVCLMKNHRELQLRVAQIVEEESAYKVH